MIPTKVGGTASSSHHYYRGTDPHCQSHRNVGPKVGRMTGQVLCDNDALVAIINHKSSKDKDVMHLLRCLPFVMAKFQFLIVATNMIILLLLRFQEIRRSLSLIHPQADVAPLLILAALLDLLLLSKPYWTS